MSRRGNRRRRGAARSTGLALAAGVAVAFCAGLGWLALSKRPTRTQAPTPGSMEPPPDVKDAGSRTGTPLAGGTELLITLVDPKEPTRVEYEITAEKSEPLPSGLYRMTRPRAWRFFRDGRSLLIEAERGQAAIPAQKEASRPEQAVLEGAVIVREYPRLEADRRPIAGVDKPTLTIRTNQLRFDGVRNEVEFPERFDVESDSITVAARGLTAAFNEAAKRLEWLKVERQLAPLVYTPAPPTPIAAKAATPGGNAAPGAPTPAKPGAAPAGPPSPAETCYHAVFGGTVLVSQGEGAVESNGAETWLRLQGDALRPGAIASATPVQSPHRSGSAILTIVELAVGAQPAVPRLADSSRGPVTMTWSGPLEARSLPQEPTELARDDVFVRFGSEAGGTARLLDAGSNARATAASIAYGATTRRGWLLGGTASPATVEQIGTGSAAAPTLAVDLGAGVARATGGPGRLRPSAWEPARENRGVDWNEQGEFTFAMTPRGEFSHLLRADLSGRVVGRDGDSSLTGEQMHAQFDQGDGSAARLTSLKVIGQVAGTDGAGASVAGDVLDATFEQTPPVGTPRPVRVSIEGHASAAQGESGLRAGRIVADLADDASGRRTVHTVSASDQVDFRGEKGLKARCDALTADAFKRTAVLTGADATIEHPDGAVHGTSITLNEVERTLRVESAGRLEHRLAADKDLPAGLLVTTWQRGLTFNDNTGLGVCEGAVLATLTRADVVRDTVSADAVQLGVTPRPAGDAKTADPRRLLTSRATGTPESPARIELRRYSLASGAPTLERLFYLEGATIIGDVAAGTMDVPTPGKALSLDRRQAAAGGASTQPFSLSTAAGRGTALLTWLGTMHVDRGEGSVKVTSGVRLVHDRAQGGDRTLLDCQSLTARFRESRAGSPAVGTEAVAGELVSASAGGGASLRSGGKTMSAPTLEYDALREVAEATGIDGSPVTVTDSAQASPLTAGKMRWDLKSGRVEVLQARPVTTPR